MADPITLAAVGSAMATPAAAGLATGTMAGTMLGAGGATLGTTAALGAAGTAALANPLITAGVNGALTGNTLLDPNVAALQGDQIGAMTPQNVAPEFQKYSAADFGPPAPTFTQSAMNTLGNVKGLMDSNPTLTNLTVNTAQRMMQPPPPPQVLQAPPIQSGQFAPVDFASLLNKRQPIQRRTSLLG